MMLIFNHSRKWFVLSLTLTYDLVLEGSMTFSHISCMAENYGKMHSSKLAAFLSFLLFSPRFAKLQILNLAH